MDKDKRQSAQIALDRLAKQRNERELILALLNLAYPINSTIEYAGVEWEVRGVYIEQCEAHLRLMKGYLIDSIPVSTVVLDNYKKNRAKNKDESNG